MKRRRTPRRVRPWLFLCGIAVLLAAVVAILTEEPRGAEAQPSVPVAAAASADPIISPGSAGLKTYRDPVTGERRAPVPGVVIPALTPAQRNARSRSHEGLQQVQGATPGGGVMVDLKGRFRSTTLSVRQSNGTYTVRCLDQVPHAPRGE